MSAPAPSFQPPALLIRSWAGVPGPATSLALWRVGTCASDCQRPILALCWVLALSLACLTVGVIGLFDPIGEPVRLLAASPAPAGPDGAEVAMIEMAAPPAMQYTPATDTELPLEAAIADAASIPEIQPDLLDLPELAQALNEKDLFEVPSAPAVETMLTPAEPSRPSPSRPTPSPTTRSRSTTSSSSNNPATTPGAGGTGGTGTSSGGSSKGYFPTPPYPAAARSRGMQGTVYLSITFGSDGRVTAASVSRSSGYSELDRTASDWVKRTWRAPAGQTGTYRQPVQFRLR
jgi:TonB family protein